MEQHGKQHSYGLLSSSVAMALSDYLVDGLQHDMYKKINDFDSNYSGMDYSFLLYAMDTAATKPTIDETRFPIPWLPDTAEPGPWSFSHYEALQNQRMS
jgi:hypothetical protein